MKRISHDIYNETRGVLKGFLESVVIGIQSHIQNMQEERPVFAMDVIYAFEETR